MSISQLAQVWLADADKTRFSGKSLAFTLYGPATDILLTGELGSGKTTFLQAFFRALGIEEAVTSPTYALEQRYTAKNGREVIHTDLYRLREDQARDLIRATDAHTAIRCIEWADRLPGLQHAPAIHLAFAEKEDGRELTVRYDDIPLPHADEIERWMQDVRLPSHIRAHCRTVADFCGRIADSLLAQGTIIRKDAVMRAGLVHDLLRFIDFHRGGKVSTTENDPLDIAQWNEIKAMYPDTTHEEACALWLRDRGYDALAQIVAVHGLRLPSPERTTIEQKVLYYADKRAQIDKIVSVDERFDDFRMRYGEGKEPEDARIWHAEAKKLEAELFPDGAPD